MASEFRATARYLRQSPRKVRLLARSLVGLTVSDAEARLSASVRTAALPLEKLLLSAAANALDRDKFPKEALQIAGITVDGGPTLKRFRPRAFGRAAPIRKRTSHIGIVLKVLPGATPVGSKASVPEGVSVAANDESKAAGAGEARTEGGAPEQRSKTMRGEVSAGKGPAGKGFMRRFFQRKSGM